MNQTLQPEVECPREAPVAVRERRYPTVAFWIVAGAALLFLGWFSMRLAGSRIYQVDEMCNIFVATQLKAGVASFGANIFQTVLSKLLPLNAPSADLFALARSLMLVVFWLNWFLLASATGEKMFSRRWLAALLGAATLAPLWDWGFEIRHDNLLLTGVLVLWCVLRWQPLKVGSCVFAGACVVLLQCLASKALVYTVPICVGVFIFRSGKSWRVLGKSFAVWMVSIAVTLLFTRVISRWVGGGYNSLTDAKSLASSASTALRFWPFDLTLSRLFTQTPLIVALSIGAVVGFLAQLAKRPRVAFDWEGNWPEIMLFGIALAALFINPNPYPYNLLHLIPYAFLLVYRFACDLWKVLSRQALVLYPTALAVVLCSHFVPFGVATARHATMTNYRQEAVMRLTEDLTDAKNDFYFDGIGMVPSRRYFDPRGFIHGQSLQNLFEGPGPRIREMLRANPPSVVIRSYRTDWLPREDTAYLKERYVPVADDFMVLGTLLPPGGESFEVIHPGRYLITSAEASNIVGTYPEPKTIGEFLAPLPKFPPLEGTVDGQPLNGKPVELSLGTHRLVCAKGKSAAVIWVGPHLDALPRMPGNYHERLFVNWY